MLPKVSEPLSIPRGTAPTLASRCLPELPLLLCFLPPFLDWGLGVEGGQISPSPQPRHFLSLTVSPEGQKCSAQVGALCLGLQPWAPWAPRPASHPQTSGQVLPSLYSFPGLPGAGELSSPGSHSTQYAQNCQFACGCVGFSDQLTRVLGISSLHPESGFRVISKENLT